MHNYIFVVFKCFLILLFFPHVRIKKAVTKTGRQGCTAESEQRDRRTGVGSRAGRRPSRQQDEVGLWIIVHEGRRAFARCCYFTISSDYSARDTQFPVHEFTLVFSSSLVVFLLQENPLKRPKPVLDVGSLFVWKLSKI